MFLAILLNLCLFCILSQSKQSERGHSLHFMLDIYVVVGARLSFLKGL